MKDDDFKLLKGFALRQTNKRMDNHTFTAVESLLLKVYFWGKFQLVVKVGCVQVDSQ